MNAITQLPDNLQAFSRFAKGKITQEVSTGKCVIYTRVSSKEQTKRYEPGNTKKGL